MAIPMIASQVHDRVQFFPSSSVSIFFCIKIASQKRNKTNAKVFSANCIALRAEEIADGDDKLHELTVTLGAID